MTVNPCELQVDPDGSLFAQLPVHHLLGARPVHDGRAAPCGWHAHIQRQRFAAGRQIAGPRDVPLETALQKRSVTVRGQCALLILLSHWTFGESTQLPLLEGSRV